MPIDVLRGFALLGILLLNIQSFAMIDAAYMNPTAYGDLSGMNFVVWLLCHVLADQKFMTIFSMLFGAGIVLMTSRAEARVGRSAALHYRRMGVLGLFGVLHAYLLWYGDILFSYAMCGSLVYLFRKVRPSRLILLGLLALLIPCLLSWLFGLSIPHWPSETLDTFEHEMWRPTPEMVAEQLEQYRGSWAQEISHRAPTTFAFQTFYFVIWTGWRAGGLMLVGMALLKLGVFSAARSMRFYLTLVLIGALVGIPIISYGVYRNLEANWNMLSSVFLGAQFNYWGSIMVSLGWVGIVMLACNAKVAAWLTRRLAAVGQMALSNYLLHTLICTTIFYGRGFGLYGRVERFGQFVIVVLIWAIQLAISPIWLRNFRFGPAEWLWRSLAYASRQPFRRITNSIQATSM